MVYGDHIHDNDGTHLDGGILLDGEWQTLWRRLIAQAGCFYNVPSGQVGWKLLADFAEELASVRSRLWNSERPFVFLMVVLQRTKEMTGSGAIRHRLLHRMEHWKKGWIVSMVDNTEVEICCRLELGGTAAEDILKERRAFEGRVTAGKLQESVHIDRGRHSRSHNWL